MLLIKFFIWFILFYNYFTHWHHKFINALLNTHLFLFVLLPNFMDFYLLPGFCVYLFDLLNLFVFFTFFFICVWKCQGNFFVGICRFWIVFLLALWRIYHFVSFWVRVHFSYFLFLLPTFMDFLIFMIIFFHLRRIRAQFLGFNE